MTLDEALEILEISDYKERIINSNSRGELFHLQQYFMLAKSLGKNGGEFREWFELIVKEANNEIVFQHILEIYQENLRAKTNKNEK